MRSELAWINTIRALCMIGVYILHTQAYMNADDPILHYVISPFYVNAFFVVSGYLFFRKWLNVDLGQGVMRKKLIETSSNLFYRLVIPTVVFASIMYIPKLFYHSKGFTFQQYLYDVFGGISFWFTSAMVVSQVILILLLLLRVTRIRYFLVMSVILTLTALICREFNPNPFPWYWKSGMVGVLVMTVGGVIYRLRHYLEQHLSLLGCIGIAGYFCSILYNIFKLEPAPCYAIMSVNFNVIGVIVTTLGIIFIFFVSYRWIPNIKIIIAVR